jgi:hypothetical protein
MADPKSPERAPQFTTEELEKRFTYHPPREGQPWIYEELRSRAFDFALFLNEAVPDSREKAIALTHLDQVVWSANAGVARRST